MIASAANSASGSSRIGAEARRGLAGARRFCGEASLIAGPPSGA